MRIDMSPEAIEARLRRASEASFPLTAATRLDSKIDLSGRGVSARLQEASDLLELSRALARGATLGR